MSQLFDPEKRKFVLPKGVRVNPQLLPVIQNLASMGLPLEEIGLALGYEGNCLDFMKNLKKKEDVDLAIKTGRSAANMQMIAQAFKCASGYEYEDSMIEYMYKPNPETGELEEVPFKKKVFYKHKPGEANLLMFMMCNLMPELFNRNQKIEIDKKELTVHAEGKLNAEHIARLAGELGKVLEQHKKKVESKIIEHQDRDARSVLPDDSQDRSGEYTISFST